LSNAVIRIDGATAPARFELAGDPRVGKGRLVGTAGTYVDDRDKQDGRWLFRRRKITQDIAGDLGLKPQ
jgi:hypothetical protein